MTTIYYFTSGCRDIELFYAAYDDVQVGKDVSWSTVIDILLDEDDMDVERYLWYIGGNLYDAIYRMGFGKSFKLITIDLDEY